MRNAFMENLKEREHMGDVREGNKTMIKEVRNK
jgi:hypothetical protein